MGGGPIHRAGVAAGVNLHGRVHGGVPQCRVEGAHGALQLGYQLRIIGLSGFGKISFQITDLIAELLHAFGELLVTAFKVFGGAITQRTSSGIQVFAQLINLVTSREQGAVHIRNNLHGALQQRHLVLVVLIEPVSEHVFTGQRVSKPRLHRDIEVRNLKVLRIHL